MLKINKHHYILYHKRTPLIDLYYTNCCFCLFHYGFAECQNDSVLLGPGGMTSNWLLLSYKYNCRVTLYWSMLFYSINKQSANRVFFYFIWKHRKRFTCCKLLPILQKEIKNKVIINCHCFLVTSQHRTTEAVARTGWGGVGGWNPRWLLVPLASRLLLWLQDELTGPAQLPQFDSGILGSVQGHLTVLPGRVCGTFMRLASRYLWRDRGNTATWHVVCVGGVEGGWSDLTLLQQ